MVKGSSISYKILCCVLKDVYLRDCGDQQERPALLQGGQWVQPGTGRVYAP